MKVTRNDVIFALGLLFAIWFAWLGMVWAYAAALVVAYPAGFISLALWYNIRNENRKRTKFIPIILLIGLILSLSVLVYLLIWD